MLWWSQNSFLFYLDFSKGMFYTCSSSLRNVNKNNFILMRYRTTILHLTLLFASLISVDLLAQSAPCPPGEHRVNQTIWIWVPDPRPSVPQMYYQPPSLPQTIPNSTSYARPSTTVLASGNKFRTFRNKSGKKVEARLLSISSKNKTASIKTKKGKVYHVPISHFSNADINYLKSWWYKRNPKKKT